MKNLNVVLAPCSALSESVYLEKGKQMNEECCSVKLWTGINYPSTSGLLSMIRMHIIKKRFFSANFFSFSYGITIHHHSFPLAEDVGVMVG